MSQQVARTRLFALLGLLAIVLLALACAKGEEKASPATPAVKPAAQAAAPTPAPAPAAVPAPAQPVAPAPREEAAAKTSQPAASPAPTKAPLVPGGPPFDQAKFSQTRFAQILTQYDWHKLPLWTKATYGGELRGPTRWNPSTTLEYLRVQTLSRPSYAGMLLLIDMGLCSMVGRDDFSKCKGEYARNNEIRIIPGIFEQWQQPDPLTYVFHIRRGVLWPAIPPMARQDREVTAEDIGWFLEITKKEGALQNNFNLVDKVEAVDRYTVRVKMQAPHAEFLRHMANTSMGIFPRECYEAKDCLGNKIVSPSPFLVAVSEPRVRAVLERNPEFYLKGLPYLDRIVLVDIPDVIRQKAAFTTRQIDVIGSITTESEILNIVKEAPGSASHSQAIMAGTIVLRPQLKGSLADVRVRRAMAMAMDQQSIWQASFDGFQIFPSLVSRDYFGADWYYSQDQAGPWYQFNPEKAKQLLGEAGYPNGFSTTIMHTSGLVSGGYHDIVVAVQASWKKYLNIDAKIQYADPIAFSSAMYAGKWPDILSQTTYNINFWASAEEALLHLTKGQRLNLQQVDDPVISDLYLKQRSELDPAKRVALLWEFEQRELDQVYVFREGLVVGFQAKQPWEFNGASHQVAYFNSPLNGPSWLAMMDPSKQPKR